MSGGRERDAHVPLWRPRRLRRRRGAETGTYEGGPRGRARGGGLSRRAAREKARRGGEDLRVEDGVGGGKRVLGRSEVVLCAGRLDLKVCVRASIALLPCPMLTSRADVVAKQNFFFAKQLAKLGVLPRLGVLPWLLTPESSIFTSILLDRPID